MSSAILLPPSNTKDFTHASLTFDAKVYGLGPLMYPSSENTSPNSTYNPTFELAYWQFGLKIASDWKVRQGISVPES